MLAGCIMALALVLALVLPGLVRGMVLLFALRDRLVVF